MYAIHHIKKEHTQTQHTGKASGKMCRLNMNIIFKQKKTKTESLTPFSRLILHDMAYHNREQIKKKQSTKQRIHST
jgi:hypothetical protein